MKRKIKPKKIKLYGIGLPINYYDKTTGYPEPTTPTKSKKKKVENPF